MTQVTFYRVYNWILLILHTKKTSEFISEVSEASTGIEPVIEVLQTFALPLGYDAIFLVTPTGIEPVLPP